MPDYLKLKSLLFCFLIVLIIPNIIFYFGQFWFLYERPVFNLDYIIPCLLFMCSKKLFKILGVLLFIVFFIIDSLLIVFQYFPSLNFRDSLYLLGYISVGPKNFMILALISTCLLALELITSLWLSTKISIKSWGVTMLIMGMLGILSYAIDNAKGLTAALYETSMIRSNTVYFIEHQKANFNTLLGGDTLQPIRFQHATSPWINALSNHDTLNDKLLLIVVESWGSPLDKTIQDDVLKKLMDQKTKFDFFEQGFFDFYGFTVEGELRELCQLHPTSLNLYQVKTGFQNCLPHQLNQLGYKTQAIHGGGSIIYGRREWYPKAGFTHRVFQEDLKKPVNCIPFDGICDGDVLPFIQQQFKENNKIFNYWLTLTAHYQYFEHDIHNKRFNCSAHNIASNSDACHNLMLHTQFFDDLAKLVAAPEMKGVEVIVVGDHPPPLFTAEEINLYKQAKDKNAMVHWLHFKIKQ